MGQVQAAERELEKGDDGNAQSSYHFSFLPHLVLRLIPLTNLQARDLRPEMYEALW